MANVIVGLRVMPSTVEVNLDELEQKIKSAINPEKIQRQPIAFGLVALIISKIVPDEGGQTDAVEQKIKSIDGVGEVEVISVSRML